MTRNEHEVVLAVHPTKSQKQNVWSEERHRFYKRTERFVYCPDCQAWGWAINGAGHSLFPKSDKTWQGKVKS